MGIICNYAYNFHTADAPSLDEVSQTDGDQNQVQLIWRWIKDGIYQKYVLEEDNNEIVIKTAKIATIRDNICIKQTSVQGDNHININDNLSYY